VLALNLRTPIPAAEPIFKKIGSDFLKYTASHSLSRYETGASIPSVVEIAETIKNQLVIPWMSKESVTLKLATCFTWILLSSILKQHGGSLCLQ